MATMPAASPSRPSMKLTAFAMTATHTTVTSGCKSRDSDSTPVNGNRKKNIDTPSRYSTDPASTWPDSLAGAEISRTSSPRPTAKMIVAAITTANGADDPSNTSLKSGSCDATAIATRKATNMAAPPTVGSGVVCTRRSPGITTRLRTTTTLRTTNVSNQVPTSATAKTMAYPP